MRIIYFLLPIYLITMSIEAMMEPHSHEQSDSEEAAHAAWTLMEGEAAQPAQPAAAALAADPIRREPAAAEPNEQEDDVVTPTGVDVVLPAGGPASADAHHDDKSDTSSLSSKSSFSLLRKLAALWGSAKKDSPHIAHATAAAAGQPVGSEAPRGIEGLSPLEQQTYSRIAIRMFDEERSSLKSPFILSTSSFPEGFSVFENVCERFAPNPYAQTLTLTAMAGDPINPESFLRANVFAKKMPNLKKINIDIGAWQIAWFLEVVTSPTEDIPPVIKLIASTYQTLRDDLHKAGRYQLIQEFDQAVQAEVVRLAGLREKKDQEKKK